MPGGQARDGRGRPGPRTRARRRLSGAPETGRGPGLLPRGGDQDLLRAAAEGARDT
ncbi:hypothetical protein SGPA1_11224 [Streptomyces misionensis JCM 4497]